MRRPAVADAVADFLIHMRLERRASPNTLRAYQRDLRSFCRFLSERGADPLTTPPAAIHRPDVRSYLTYLRRERSLRASSVARHLACLRSFFRFLQGDPAWGLPHDPTAGLVQPRPPHRPQPPLTPPQVERLLAACQERSPYPWRDRSALQLVAATACRVSQLPLLRLRDLVLAGPYVILPGHREPRLAVLDHATAAVLQNYLRHERPQLAAASPFEHDAPDGPLFLGARGTALSAASIERLFRRAWAHAGLPHPVSIQALRRSSWREAAAGARDWPLPTSRLRTDVPRRS